jgi:hypothetical protein
MYGKEFDGMITTLLILGACLGLILAGLLYALYLVMSHISVRWV